MTDRLAALAVLVAAGAYLAGALPLPRGVAARPGAGFFPLVVGVFFCLAAAGFVLETPVVALARRTFGARPAVPEIPR